MLGYLSTPPPYPVIPLGVAVSPSGVPVTGAQKMKRGGIRERAGLLVFPWQENHGKSRK